jgi:hypothetical protein
MDALSRGWLETAVRLTDEQKSALEASISHHADHPDKRFPAAGWARHLYFIRVALMNGGDEFKDLLRSSPGRNGCWSSAAHHRNGTSCISAFPPVWSLVSAGPLAARLQSLTTVPRPARPRSC